MSTLILRDTYLVLEEEMKSLDKLRSETALKIQEAASHGDLKENYEYKAAKEAMELLMFKKELLQSHSPFQFIEFGEIDTDTVGFGNLVTVHDDSKNKTDDYYVLGPVEFELDLYPFIVTYHSPFAKAMVGKKINENFTLEIRGKEIKFTITAIQRISSELKK